MKAYVLQDGGFKYFVQKNGRIYDYYPPLHDRMCDVFDAALPRIGRQKMPEDHMALFPRGTLKTTLVEELQAYVILKYPTIQMQYIRGTKDLAADILFEVRREALVTPFIVRVWGSIEEGDIIKRDSQYEFSIGTNKDPTIRCGGVEGSLTGSHPDFAILDDIVDEENYASRVLSRNIRHCIAFLRPKLHPQHGNKLVLGTLWPKSTFYDEVIAENERHEKRYAEAMKEGKLEEAQAIFHKIWHIDKAGVHNDDGTLLFPKLSEEFLKHAKEDPRTAEFYPGWYEMTPVGGGEKHFPREKRKWFTGQLYHGPMPHLALTDLGGSVVDEVPVDIHMTYDGTLSANAGSDFVGITINAVSSDDRWYVLSCKAYKEMPSDMTQIVCLQLMVFRPLYLWDEAGCISGEMMADVQKFITEHDLPTVIRDIKGLSRKAGAKAQRINALNTRYKRGDIVLQQGPWCRDLVEQMDEWTGICDLEHDDCLDSLSMQSGVARPCGIERLSELVEEDPRDDPNWVDPGIMGDWQARPWANVKIAEGAMRSFDGGPSRFALEMEEAGQVVVNMGELYPDEKAAPRRYGGHAGIHSRRKGTT